MHELFYMCEKMYCMCEVKVAYVHGKSGMRVSFLMCMCKVTVVYVLIAFLINGPNGSS